MLARRCPDCQSPLSPEVFSEVHIDVCQKCAGVWFDDGELTDLQKRGMLSHIDEVIVPELERGKGPRGARECPACEGVLLDEYTYMYSTPVRIDGCPACYGIWVQDGELRAMENLAYQARTQPVPPGTEHKLALAEMMVEHERNQSRHRLFQNVMRVFSLRRPRRIL